MRFLFAFIFFFFSFLFVHAQQTTSISGYVKDALTGELLIGASVEVVDSPIKSSSNSYGYFVLDVPSMGGTLRVSYVGYQELIITLDSVAKGTRLQIELTPLGKMLDEVVVSGKKENKNVSSPQMGALNFSMEEVKNIPVVFGEKDIMKTIQLLP